MAAVPTDDRDQRFDQPQVVYQPRCQHHSPKDVPGLGSNARSSGERFAKALDNNVVLVGSQFFASVKACSEQREQVSRMGIVETAGFCGENFHKGNNQLGSSRAIPNQRNYPFV